MLISIVVPVFQPEQNLEEILSNLKNQILPPGYKIEILIVDGENSDSTKDFCVRHKLKYFVNKAQDPVTSRYIGFELASGDLVCFIDQDERFCSNSAIEIRIKSFLKHRNLVILFPTGYKIGSHMNTPNMYSSIFGDPFNQFFYKLPNDDNRAKLVSRKLNLTHNEGVYLNSNQIKKPNSILLEFGNMGSVVNKTRLKKILHFEINASDIPNLFFLLFANLNTVGILKNDLVIHHSSQSWKTVRKKIKWRIYNNIYDNKTNINFTSLSNKYRGRYTSDLADLHKRVLLIKKIWFVILVLIPIWPIASSLKLVIHFRRIQFFYIILLNYYLVLTYGILKFKLVWNKILKKDY
jgi:glycosyltransferase involved in cell wall biosynthesis